jgi:uncharacterized protein (UPF0332 family)
VKEQTKKMLDKAKESIAAAALLAEQGYMDFAASRAYYARFYIAEALLLERGLSYSSHSAVIAGYGKEFSKSRELDPKYHKYLIAAQDFRSQGDYTYDSSVSAEHAQNTLDWANEFLAATSAYLAKI